MVMQYFISLAVSYGFNHVTQDAFITQPIPNYKIINYFKFSFCFKPNSIFNQIYRNVCILISMALFGSTQLKFS